ncbi:MAG TPA: rod shape-determining protein RodA [Gammaproteobacteria bacterium]|nr:rod shape-determining protein RodA [Gammaproteobacteria bacterium]
MLFDDEYPAAQGVTGGLGRLLERLHLDPPLLAGLLLLCGVGLVILYSAGGESEGILLRQGLRMVLAFGVMIVVAQIPPLTMRIWTPLLYLGGVILLILVAWMGDVGQGAQRWLDLGVVRFQPSEVMKLAVPMMVASFLHYRSLPPRLRHVAWAAALILVPVVLIARQPDLGTAVLVASAGLFTLFLAGLRWRYIWGLALSMAALAPVIWFHLRDYQKQRVLTFFNPEQDPLGAGYHIIQSKIAIGSGGLFGKGWLNGTQAHLQFLPERSTDFIFAVLGEEFGLVGLCLLLALYLYVIGRGLQIAIRAQDTFERLLAGSLSLTLFVYVFVNAGMVTGLMPVVGVPLPLISYGGTSMVTLMAGFGILMSIHTHRKLVA